MQYIFCQPANTRFQWELEVVITNLRSLDKSAHIILVFLEENSAVLSFFKTKYPDIEIHHYPDGRANKGYIPAIKPYLFYRFLESNPQRQEETFFLLDSDIIFREIPSLPDELLEGKVAIGSDCGGYLDYDYLRTRTNGDLVLTTMAQAARITVEDIKSLPGAGAHWVITQPTAAMSKEVYELSTAIWMAISPLETNLQKWTAEMWAMIYGLHKHGYKVKTDPELKFCWATDSIEMWDHTKILHNAGVMGEGPAGLFFKGKYSDHSPFGEDLSWVRKDRCSWHYVQAIEAAKKSV